MKGEQRDVEIPAVIRHIPALVDGDGRSFRSLAIISISTRRIPIRRCCPRSARRRRGSQIVACIHPLIVPRVREYLAHEFKVDEAGVIKWAQHWHKLALTALEQNLSSSKETGQSRRAGTTADICVASQAAELIFKSRFRLSRISRLVQRSMPSRA
jgi:glutathione S-transferase